jgi:hypothetical protein
MALRDSIKLLIMRCALVPGEPEVDRTGLKKKYKSGQDRRAQLFRVALQQVIPSRFLL